MKDSVKLAMVIIGMYAFIALVAIGCNFLGKEPARNAMDVAAQVGCVKACEQLVDRIEIDNCFELCTALADILEDNLDQAD